MAQLRVLVIDDNETNRRILAKMLQNWGMVPVVVDSAAKGLQALQASFDEQPIGLVLSDVNMPEMDGFMFARQVKDQSALKHTPIILLTSANRSGDGALCRELGIANLTLYAFSTENWHRPKAEITALMTLLKPSWNQKKKN